jgi:CubicO group peptidase (beta-lactamase class C family)
MNQLTAVVEKGMADGLHIGAQVYASVNGEMVIDSAWGFAQKDIAMTRESIMLWLSSTKPVAAVAIGQMWEKGKLELDDAVAKYIPDFAAEGKQAVTIRHILTHTCGFRAAALNWSEEPWDQTIAKICSAKLETGWVAGKKAGYHVSGSWFMLGEIVRRIDGRAFHRYVREEIFLPLQMKDSWVGMPVAQFRTYADRIGIMHDTSGETPKPFVTETEAGFAICRPGGNGHGPVRELGFFYEAMLGKGLRAGRRVLLPQTAEALMSCHRRGMYDQTFAHVMDWGLGFIVDNNIHGFETVPYPFGKYCSPRTVGHGGYQSSVGFCDPEYGLACAIVFNGCPGEVKHGARIRAATAAIYEDLGLNKS